MPEIVQEVAQPKWEPLVLDSKRLFCGAPRHSTGKPLEKGGGAVLPLRLLYCSPSPPDQEGLRACWSLLGPLMPGPNSKAQSLKGKQERRRKTVRQDQESEPGTERARTWLPNATSNRGSGQAPLTGTEFKPQIRQSRVSVRTGSLPVQPGACLWGVRYQPSSCRVKE